MEFIRAVKPEWIFGVSTDSSERGIEGPGRFASFYKLAFSLRFVFLDPVPGAGSDDSLEVEFFFWQVIAHHRPWYCGSSHIFVQCLAADSYAQWQ